MTEKKFHAKPFEMQDGYTKAGIVRYRSQPPSGDAPKECVICGDYVVGGVEVHAVCVHPAVVNSLRPPSGDALREAQLDNYGDWLVDAGLPLRMKPAAVQRVAALALATPAPLDVEHQCNEVCVGLHEDAPAPLDVERPDGFRNTIREAIDAVNQAYEPMVGLRDMQADDAAWERSATPAPLDVAGPLIPDHEIIAAAQEAVAAHRAKPFSGERLMAAIRALDAVLARAYAEQEGGA